MIAEALTVLWSLGAALLIWLALIATAAVLALEALAIALYRATRAAWRLLRPHRRRRPSWARTRRSSRHHARTRPDYQEAA
ncbi:hypothetical protein [Streptomyces broussonetiae]|uniref:Uncharacterized protein n=1 Tax=Streptomyces broussonetiae TaxID=2686304 RepID=A0ABV5E5K2_9ACTN